MLAVCAAPDGHMPPKMYNVGATSLLSAGNAAPAERKLGASVVLSEASFSSDHVPLLPVASKANLHSSVSSAAPPHFPVNTVMPPSSARGMYGVDCELERKGRVVNNVCG